MLKKYGIVGLVILVLGLVTQNIRTCNELKKQIEKEKTNRAIIENPRVVEEPATKIKATEKKLTYKKPESSFVDVFEKEVDIVDTSEKPKVKIIEGPNLGFYEVIERVIEIEKAGGKTIEPISPPSIEEVLKSVNWEIGADYNLTDSYIGFEIKRRIYKSIKIKAGYNLNETSEVGVSIGF